MEPINEKSNGIKKLKADKSLAVAEMGDC